MNILDKWYTKLSLWACFFAFTGLITQSCSEDTVENPEEIIKFKAPSNFPAVYYNFANNPITNDGFKLGKSLFYDGILSKDGTISCGSCHQQFSAFAHKDHNISHGVEDRLGDRNSPPVMNLAWQTFFFWDGGVNDLDKFSINPIENQLEMDEKIENVLNKLRNSTKYKDLFKKAYGSEEITTAKTMKALSQFMLMCVSADSKYDKYIRKEGVTLTENEAQGKTIFAQKCGSCHSGELFTDYSFRNNGLPKSNVNDLGRAKITLNQDDNYKFKVPSLRNIEYTAPYMHDGRFSSLEGVLNHYRIGFEDSPTLDPIFKNQPLGNGKYGIPLTQEEQSLIIEFLKTLSDQAFLKNSLLEEEK